MINSLLIPSRVLSLTKVIKNAPAISRNRIGRCYSATTVSPPVVTDADLFAIDLPTNENSDNLLRLRHSAAHVMAMAVQRLHPKAKVTIGPWIENGFYYDFLFPEKQLDPEDLKAIKKEMDKIIRANLPIRREEVSREEARERILKADEPFKLEILDSIKSDIITIYHIGEEWWDVCAGPHVESTGKLNQRAVELQSLAGAYWRGDEKNPMLQRIYGTAWESDTQLSVYKKRLEEAKRRDHRVVGKKLDLFSIQEDAGGGLVFWHPKGASVRKQIEDYWKNAHLKAGYELLYTPHIANLDLWKTSGHFDFYKDDMFKTIEVDDDQFQLKPMNCPFHCLVYKDKPRSYRELPLRWAELGTVYRYERSGTLHGLFRVRGFTQDDGHVFCLPSQLETEIVNVLDLTETILKKFGFSKFDVMLSTKPKEYVGSDDIWSKATDALVGALKVKNWEYKVDEGGGAFYGPKIDIKIQDAIGRKWQCSTIQCDFNLPERFQLEYSSNDQTKQRPIMVHRAIFGSLERFMGVLTESTAGDFPLWISPVHIRLLPVTDDVLDYCYEIKKMAENLNIRVEIDTSGQRIAKMIRNSEQERIPIVGVIGLKERDNNSISVRIRREGDIGKVDRNSVLELIENCIKANVECSGESVKSLSSFSSE